MAQSLEERDATTLQRLVPPISFLANEAPTEQTQLLTELLSSEFSPEGLAVLERDGDFGPLHNLFPTEADAWAKTYAVSADDCVAFRLTRNGTTAELVLHRSSDGTFRVLRANDIRQLAQPISTP